MVGQVAISVSNEFSYLLGSNYGRLLMGAGPGTVFGLIVENSFETALASTTGFLADGLEMVREAGATGYTAAAIAGFCFSSFAGVVDTGI